MTAYISNICVCIMIVEFFFLFHVLTTLCAPFHCASISSEFVLCKVLLMCLSESCLCVYCYNLFLWNFHNCFIFFFLTLFVFQHSAFYFNMILTNAIADTFHQQTLPFNMCSFSLLTFSPPPNSPIFSYIIAVVNTIRQEIGIIDFLACTNYDIFIMNN